MATLSTDPIDYLLDADGDVVITDDVSLSTGLPAVAQRIRIRLQVFRGEWFLDLDFGVPYWQDLLGQRFDIVRARAAIREQLVNTPDVTELLTFGVEFDRASRELQVTWSVRTVFGDIAEETFAL